MDLVYFALGLVWSIDKMQNLNQSWLATLIFLRFSQFACLFFEGNLVSRPVRVKYVSTIRSDKGLTLETPALTLLKVANLR